MLHGLQPGDVKEPAHLSKRVDNVVPCEVAWSCYSGLLHHIGIASLQFLFLGRIVQEKKNEYVVCFQMDTVSSPRNRIKNDTVSKCLHGTFLSTFKCFPCAPYEAHHIYDRYTPLEAATFVPEYVTVSPFSTVYTTNEIVSFWKRSTFVSVFKTTRFQCRSRSVPYKRKA